MSYDRPSLGGIFYALELAGSGLIIRVAQYVVRDRPLLSVVTFAKCNVTHSMAGRLIARKVRNQLKSIEVMER